MKKKPNSKVSEDFKEDIIDSIKSEHFSGIVGCIFSGESVNVIACYIGDEQIMLAHEIFKGIVKHIEETCGDKKMFAKMKKTIAKTHKKMQEKICYDDAGLFNAQQSGEVH